MVNDGLQTIRKEDLRSMIGSKNAIVVNVLEEEAYRKSHIKGSISIPLEKLTEGEFNKLDKSKKIITYCASYQCTSSRQAAEFLREKGYDSYAYEGGMREWTASGLPLEISEQ